MFRQILTFHLAAILFISNIGIPVFTHICHTQGKVWSSIYVPAKSCCSKKKPGSTPACHNALKNKNTSSTLKSRPCCENHGALLKIDTDFVQKLPSVEKISLIKFSVPGYFDDPSSQELSQQSSYKLYQSHGPPITLHGRSLLISQQIFRC